MFDELDKYKNKGHFFFKKGDDLKATSKDVPNIPGVYYVLKLARGKVDLIYIGKSDIIQQNSKFKEHGLQDRINTRQEGKKYQEFFDLKCSEENIDALDIYWFVTFDRQNQDLPGFVEGLIMQRYFEIYEKLPLWNKEY